MKKVLLTLSVVVGLNAYAQTEPATQYNLLNPELRLAKAEADQMLQLVKARNYSQKAKTNGGVISKQMIGFSDTLYQFYGGSAIFGGLFQVPIYQDSSLKQEFTDVTSHIDQHAVGMTYDPASLIWGKYQFTEADALTIDSVHIFGKYDTPSSIPSPSGDSLIVEMTWAPKFPGSARNNAFQGVYYAPNANNPDTCRQENPLVDVTAVGSAWKLKGGNYLRTGIALTSADLAGTGDPTRLYSIAVNKLIPAGNLVAVSFKFKSAYAAMTSVGDTFFSTVDVENTKIPNFATRLASENIAGGTWFFCDNLGLNSTSELTSTTLYQTNGNFRDSMYSGRVTGGYFTYLTVSGTSTVGLAEKTTETNLQIFPNPSSGVVHVSISQSGSYQLELMNILGQVVFTENIRSTDNESIRVDLGHLASGVYLLNIRGENFSQTSKLNIER